MTALNAYKDRTRIFQHSFTYGNFTGTHASGNYSPEGEMQAIKSAKITVGDQSLGISYGVTISQKLDLEIYGDNPQTYKNKYIRVYAGIMADVGDGERDLLTTPMGYFKVSECDYNSKARTIKITAYDDMYYILDDLWTPIAGTLAEIIIDIGGTAIVNNILNEAANWSLTLAQSQQLFGQKKKREVLAEIGKFLGCNFYVDAITNGLQAYTFLADNYAYSSSWVHENGYIPGKDKNKAITGAVIGAKDTYITMDFTATPWTATPVMTKQSTYPQGDSLLTYDSILYTYQLHGGNWGVSNFPLIAYNEGTAPFIALVNALNSNPNNPFISGSISTFGHPYMEPGDVIGNPTASAEQSRLIIAWIEYNMTGGFSATYGCADFEAGTLETSYFDESGVTEAGNTGERLDNLDERVTDLEESSGDIPDPLYMYNGLRFHTTDTKITHSGAVFDGADHGGGSSEYDRGKITIDALDQKIEILDLVTNRAKITITPGGLAFKHTSDATKDFDLTFEELRAVDELVKYPRKIIDILVYSKTDGLQVPGSLSTLYLDADGLIKVGGSEFSNTANISGLDLRNVKQLRVVYMRNDGVGVGNYNAMGEFTIPLEYPLPNADRSTTYGEWYVGGAISPTIRDTNRLTGVMASVWYPTGGSLANCNFTFNDAWTLYVYGTAQTSVGNLRITNIYACY